MKRHAPAAARNRQPLEAVLREELPTQGLVLEIASGTGEHAVHFSRAFPALTWQPSDADRAAIASIAAWRAEELQQGKGANLRSPVPLDAAGNDWPLTRAEAMVCINMVHIAPPEAAIGLMLGAGRVLARGSPLILYGPFLEEGIAPASSNLAFDLSLRKRDPRWGLREVRWLDALAESRGLSQVRRVEMPANNLVLVYRQTPVIAPPVRRAVTG